MIWIDDGYFETFKHALPILKENNIKAVWAICPGLIGGELEGGKLIGWKEIKELVSAGQIIACHTMYHRLEDFDVDVRLAKIILDKKLGIRINHFVYPYDKIPDKSTMTKVNVLFDNVRPFYTYSFHLIGFETYKYYPFFLHLEEFMKFIRLMGDE